jgi:hypothetical protein
MLYFLEKASVDWLSRDQLLAQILPIHLLFNQNVFMQKKSVNCVTCNLCPFVLLYNLVIDTRQGNANF